MESLIFFIVISLIQGLIFSVLVWYFNLLSQKRRQKRITEFEKWQQATMSPVIDPVLETMLTKDEEKTRIIITVCVLVSGITTIIFTSSDVFIFILSAFLITATWLSKKL